MANVQNAGTAHGKNKTRTTPKAVWNSELHKFFVELCYDEMLKGNKRGTVLSKEGMKTVIERFAEKTGKHYDKKQMKNHWDNTKSEWKVWNKLKTKETGLGWDYVKNTIDASDDWWAIYIQSCPEATKYRDKGIEHATELTALFEGMTATGQAVWAPSQGSLPDDSVGPFQGQSRTVNIEERNDIEVEPNNEVQNEEDPIAADLNQDNEDDGDTNGTRRRRRSREWTPPPERRRRVSSAANMNKQLERICDAIESRSVAMSNRVDQGCTVKECIEILNQMPEVIRGSDLYMFACRLFLKREQRELFIALVDPDLRLSWLQREKILQNTPHP